MNEHDEPIDESVYNTQDFWQTTQGRFRIKIEELPDQLQLVYHILKVCLEFKILNNILHSIGYIIIDIGTYTFYILNCIISFLPS